jgi:hypothetical protein
MLTSTRFLPLLAALVLVGALAAPTSAAGPDRLVWSYEGGYFKDQGPGEWVERNPSGEYHFVEVRRNRDFVELRDDSRDCTVRLYRCAMYLRGPNGQHPDFDKLYDGRWTQ